MKKKLLKISIVGKTNAGKSTLLNNIIGETISITNKKINTTEDLITGVCNIKEHQLIFYDTPGLNYIKNLNKNKIKLKQNFWNAFNETDIIIYLIDLKKYNTLEVSNNLKMLLQINKRIIIIFNKNDLLNKKIILPKIKELDNKFNIESFFSISAKKKLGLNQIKNYLINKTYFSDWIYEQDEISDKDDIFISNEITRNSILTLLHKEIPYNLNIINKMFKYLKNGDLKIKQEIELNNIRYKKIILGKNGEKIKNIRIKSQKNISKILKVKVHLYINIIKSNAKKI